MSFNTPNIDPSNNDSLAGTIQFLFSQLMKSIDGVKPAKIVKYDRTTRRAQVQILINTVTTNGASIAGPQISSVPVFQMGGGGYVMDFPLNQGDLGILLANDRDISAFLQNYSAADPNTNRVKSFSDAIFIPIMFTGYSVAPEDATNLVIQNLSGTVKISLGTDTMTFTAPNFIFNGDVLANGGFNATGGMNISGGGATPLNITGDLRVVGDITASGDITPHVP